MNFSPEEERGVFVHHSNVAAEMIKVYGDIDISNADAFSRSIARVVETEAGRPIVVDLRSCAFIGSHALFVLAHWGETIGQRLKVWAPPKFARLFHIVELDDLLAPEDGIEVARA